MILANDGAYLQESYEKHIIPGFVVDKTLAEKSLEWLTDCKNDAKCLEVLANHDPCIKEHTIKFDVMNDMQLLESKGKI